MNGSPPLARWHCVLQEEPGEGLAEEHGGDLGAVLPPGLAVVDGDEVGEHVLGVEHQEALPDRPGRNKVEGLRGV